MKKIIINVDYTASERSPRAWHDSALKNAIISVKNISEIKTAIARELKARDFILNKKIRFRPMYKDVKGGELVQTGFVADVYTEDFDDKARKWKNYYFCAWIEVAEVKSLFEEGAKNEKNENVF